MFNDLCNRIPAIDEDALEPSDVTYPSSDAFHCHLTAPVSPWRRRTSIELLRTRMSVAEPLSTKTTSTPAVKGSDRCIDEESWRGRSQRGVPLLASIERIVVPPGPDNKTRPTPTDEIQE